MIVASIGIRRTVPSRSYARWIAALVGLFGLGMIGAGIFSADPAYGFPPGTPPGKAITTTVHGDLHLVFGSLGFIGLIAATFVTASCLQRNGDPRRARLSIAAGIIFLLSDLSGVVLASHHEVAYNLTLTAGIVIGFAWLSWISTYWYQRASDNSVDPQAGAK